ncbi:MAG TPA: DUF481 domain-containing protein [Burkholderiaceae bacterium]|nr:DUF481 domain-containing protein [Burkholderiaceae bacterium]
MKSIPLTTLALALSIAHGAASARTAPERTWNTSAELGAIATSGNTVGASVTGKIDARQELEDWSNEYVVSAYFKEDENRDNSGQQVRERSAERYSASAKAAYKLLEEGEKLFVLGSHVADRFGAYTSYSTFGVGHGSRWYTDEDKTLDVEIGPGYFSGRRAGGQAEKGVTIRGAAALKWQLSDAAVFSQNLSVERGTSNVHSLAESALRTKINSTMQMKAAFSVRNDTDVPADKKNTDTQTSVTLVYSF